MPPEDRIAFVEYVTQKACAEELESGLNERVLFLKSLPQAFGLS
jgi:hypothetical protein